MSASINNFEVGGGDGLSEERTSAVCEIWGREWFEERCGVVWESETPRQTE